MSLLGDRRRELGLRQQDLAEQVGVSRQWIVEVEHGKPRAELGLVLRALAALDLPLTIGGSAPSSSAEPLVPAIDLDAVIARARGKAEGERRSSMGSWTVGRSAGSSGAPRADWPSPTATTGAPRARPTRSPSPQPKTALLLQGGRWGVPSGRVPTTHILKPPLVGLDGHAENEHLCLAPARRLRLDPREIVERVTAMAGALPEHVAAVRQRAEQDALDHPIIARLCDALIERAQRRLQALRAGT